MFCLKNTTFFARNACLIFGIATHVACAKDPQTTLSYNYEEARKIVNENPPAQCKPLLAQLLHRLVAERDILEKVCPGYAQMSAQDQDKVKDVVLTTIVKLYASIFEKHCKSSGSFLIKETMPMGNDRVKVIATVTHPNTGSLIKLHFIMQGNFLLDVQVEGLSLLNSLANQGQQFWRKAGHDVEKFMAYFKKAHG